MNRDQQVILAAKPHKIQARTESDCGETASKSGGLTRLFQTSRTTVNHSLDGGLEGVASYNVRFAPK